MMRYLTTLGLCILGSGCDGAGTDDLDTTTDAPAPCGNGTLDDGESCDGSDLDGATCADLEGFVDGDLGCDDTCEVVTSACVSASTWIQDVLDQPDGTGLDLPISKAIVTDTRPAIGNDPAGFFVQAAPDGPALFIAVDPAAVDGDPDVDVEVGDALQFDVEAIRTVAGTRFVEGFGNLVVQEPRGPSATAALVQDVTATDAATIVNGLDDYVSELVLVRQAEIDSAGFAAAGEANVAARLFTTGIPVPGDADFRIRAGDALVDTLDLAGGCVVTVESPLWRFNDQAQVSVYKEEDITIEACPAPQVTGVEAVDTLTVRVTFSRRLDASSVDAIDFTFSDGLMATAAALEDDDARAVIVTTSLQAALDYTVTVDGLLDQRGEGIDPAANRAVFTGISGFEPRIYISELDADTADETQEFVELWNNGPQSVNLATDKHWLLFLNGNGETIYNAVQLTGTLASNGTYLVGNTTSPTPDIVLGTSSIQNGADGVLLVSCPACLDADSGFTEFPLGGDVGTAVTFTTNQGATATKVDGVAYDTNDADDADLIARCYPTVDFPQEQFNEDANAARESESLSRTGPQLFEADTPSPGSP